MPKSACEEQEKGMDFREKKNDLMVVISAATKKAISRIPGLGEAIAGWDAYKQNVFNRNVHSFMDNLSIKIDNMDSFIHNEWFQTKEGEQFIRKVVDAALDEQLQDKQEFFINAMINGVNDQTTSQLEKLKFIDILRQLSRSALIVLAEIHNMSKDQVRGPGRKPDRLQPLPLVDAGNIAGKLSDKYDPYLITSAVSELESQGIFSRTGEWTQDPFTKRYRPGVGFNTDLCYTDFAARFVEFISTPQKK